MDTRMKTIKLKIGYDNVPSNYTGIVEWEERKIFWYKNGNLHREDGPAYIDSSGYEEWWLNGKNYFSESEWKKELEKLKKKSPIKKKIEKKIDSKVLKLNSKKDSIPENYTGVVEWEEQEKEYKVWLKDGEWHREDGPAIVYNDGEKEWWLDGICIWYSHHKKLDLSKCIILSKKHYFKCPTIQIWKYIDGNRVREQIVIPGMEEWFIE